MSSCKEELTKLEAFERDITDLKDKALEKLNEAEEMRKSIFEKYFSQCEQ